MSACYGQHHRTKRQSAVQKRTKKDNRKNRMEGTSHKAQAHASSQEQSPWVSASPASPPNRSITISRWTIPISRRWARCAASQTASPDFRLISLTDAEIGDEVLLINFEHLPTDSPYRSRHAVYIRRNERRFDANDDVPAMLRTRLLSVRAFDDAGMMVGADVIDGKEIEGAIATQFGNPDASYLHIHFAKPGCFAARVDRN